MYKTLGYLTLNQWQAKGCIHHMPISQFSVPFECTLIAVGYQSHVPFEFTPLLHCSESQSSFDTSSQVVVIASILKDGADTS